VSPVLDSADDPSGIHELPGAGTASTEVWTEDWNISGQTIWDVFSDWNAWSESQKA
jgi:hypothetical protein